VRLTSAVKLQKVFRRWRLKCNTHHRFSASAVYTHNIGRDRYRYLSTTWVDIYGYKRAWLTCRPTTEGWRFCKRYVIELLCFMYIIPRNTRTIRNNVNYLYRIYIYVCTSLPRGDTYLSTRRACIIYLSHKCMRNSIM